MSNRCWVSREYLRTITISFQVFLPRYSQNTSQALWLSLAEYNIKILCVKQGATPGGIVRKAHNSALAGSLDLIEYQ